MSAPHAGSITSSCCKSCLSSRSLLLPRSYRGPSVLNEVQHQDGAVRFLRRVVEGNLTTPLLLLGLEGVGRRFAALQVAQELFCTGDRTASCPCVDCAQVRQGIHPDLLVVAPHDGKDVGVDAAREAIEVLGTYPTQTPVRVVIFDGADKLTMPAANALLKTLEEPPATSRVFLLAESRDLVLPTIRSRCGTVFFPPLPEAFICSRLQRFEADSTRALVYARLAEGSLGRAVQFWGAARLALRDKVMALLTSAVARDVASVFSAIDGFDKDLPLAMRFLTMLVHDLLVLSVDETRMINLDLTAPLRALRPPTPTTWQQLHASLDTLLAKARTTRLQLGFHAKSLLLETFIGA
jgi:DNA polymerase-3 subunit delta'